MFSLLEAKEGDIWPSTQGLHRMLMPHLKTSWYPCHILTNAYLKLIGGRMKSLFMASMGNSGSCGKTE